MTNKDEKFFIKTIKHLIGIAKNNKAWALSADLTSALNSIYRLRSSCPKCGSDDIELIEFFHSRGSMGYFGKRKEYYCNHCGKVSRAR
jgi:hypothetical protein